MKLVFSILLFSSFFIYINSDDTIKKILVWHTDIEVALKASQENKKNILIVFSGSDWCVNCIKLKKNVFSTPAFETFAIEQFNLLLLDFPSGKANALSEKQKKHNEALAEKYNKDGVFPLCIILSPESKVVGEIKSYSNETSEKFIQSIKDLLAKKP